MFMDNENGASRERNIGHKEKSFFEVMLELLKLNLFICFELFLPACIISGQWNYSQL
jgi:hypothetical protein